MNRVVDVISKGRLEATPLPDGMMMRIGRFATDWALIEQAMARMTLALSAKTAPGAEPPWLRGEFKKLHERWTCLARECASRQERPIVDQLDRRLSDAAPSRDILLHGTWRRRDDGSFQVDWLASTGTVVERSLRMSEDEFAGQLKAVEELRRDILGYMNEPH